MMKSRSAHRLALSLAIAALAPLPVRAADLQSEIVTAGMHANLASQAGNLDGVHMHLHHALNCLVGPNGTGFDAKQLNPCANSGGGAIPDTTDAGKKKTLEAAVDKAQAGIATSDVAAAKKDAADIATILKGVK